MNTQDTNEDEAKQHKSQIFYDEQSNVIRYHVVGKLDEDLAESTISQLTSVIDNHPEADGILVNGSDLKTVTGTARQMYADFLAEYRLKTAFFNMNRILRVVAKMVFGVVERGEDMRVFNTEEEALAWVQEAG